MKTSTIVLKPVKEGPIEQPKVVVEEDAAYSLVPLLQYGAGTYESRLIMTKEAFQEMYKKWIVSYGLDR